MYPSGYPLRFELRSAIKLSEFTGGEKEDADIWIALAQRYLRQQPLSDSQQVDAILFSLTGRAKEALGDYAGMDSFTNVQEIFDALHALFGPKGSSIQRVYNARQSADEPVTLFLARVRKYARGIGKMERTAADEIALLFFLLGLRPEIQKKMPQDTPTTISLALAKAQAIEGELAAKRETKTDTLFAMMETTVPRILDASFDQSRTLQMLLNRLDRLPFAIRPNEELTASGATQNSSTSLR